MEAYVGGKRVKAALRMCCYGHYLGFVTLRGGESLRITRDSSHFGASLNNIYIYKVQRCPLFFNTAEMESIVA
ncbi:hypothetical protein ACOSQ3_021678 [Xanthoceras sorbifolium]